MVLVEHPGPKAQIFLAGRADPLWFTQVRDAIAFTRLPEEPRDITAIWVNDMGRATNWEAPEAGAWADARSAWFVIASAAGPAAWAPRKRSRSEPSRPRGPSRRRMAARVVRLAEIPDDYVLGWMSPPDDRAAAAPSRPARHERPARPPAAADRRRRRRACPAGRRCPGDARDHMALAGLGAGCRIRRSCWRTPTAPQPSRRSRPAATRSPGSSGSSASTGPIPRCRG